MLRLQFKSLSSGIPSPNHFTTFLLYNADKNLLLNFWSTTRMPPYVLGINSSVSNVPMKCLGISLLHWRLLNRNFSSCWALRLLFHIFIQHKRRLEIHWVCASSQSNPIPPRVFLQHYLHTPINCPIILLLTYCLWDEVGNWCTRRWSQAEYANSTQTVLMNRIKSRLLVLWLRHYVCWYMRL